MGSNTYTYTHIHSFKQTYIHTYTHTYTHTKTHTYTHTYTNTYTHIHAQTHKHTHTHLHTHTYTRIHTHTYTHTYIHTYICTYTFSFFEPAYIYYSTYSYFCTLKSLSRSAWCMCRLLCFEIFTVMDMYVCIQPVVYSRTSSWCGCKRPLTRFQRARPLTPCPSSRTMTSWTLSGQVSLPV